MIIGGFNDHWWIQQSLMDSTIIGGFDKNPSLTKELEILDGVYALRILFWKGNPVKSGIFLKKTIFSFLPLKLLR